MSNENSKLQTLQLEEKISKLTLENESLKNQLFKVEYLYNFFNKYAINSETNKKGEITYVSQPFIDISGYTEKELIGSNHSIVRHPDMSNEVFKKMWETITAKKVWRGEIKNQKKDGGFYWVDSIIFPILNQKDEIEGFKSIRFDITDSKRVDDIFEDILDVDDSIEF